MTKEIKLTMSSLRLLTKEIEWGKIVELGEVIAGLEHGKRAVEIEKRIFQSYGPSFKKNKA